MDKNEKFQRISFSDFFNNLLEEELGDKNKYDPEIVTLIRDHLGQANLHSQAGKRLAESLIELAKQRSMEMPS